MSQFSWTIILQCQQCLGCSLFKINLIFWAFNFTSAAQDSDFNTQFSGNDIICEKAAGVKRSVLKNHSNINSARISDVLETLSAGWSSMSPMACRTSPQFRVAQLKNKTNNIYTLSKSLVSYITGITSKGCYRSLVKEWIWHCGMPWKGFRPHYKYETLVLHWTPCYDHVSFHILHLSEYKMSPKDITFCCSYIIWHTSLLYLLMMEFYWNVIPNILSSLPNLYFRYLLMCLLMLLGSSR